MMKDNKLYTYEEVIDKIEHARRFGKQPGVEVTARALEVLGHPEDGLKFVHVAGTNGKGSVCAFLGSILREAGKKVGVFTSPHLIAFEERIVVDGERISKEDVVRLGNRLLATDFGVELTMFDYCLLMAVLYFTECGCDIAIMETGLGGRLDSTNALGVPEVAVITRIGYDHMAILGNTLGEIAGEKAGILKPGCKFVMGPQEPEAEKVLIETARRCGLEEVRANIGKEDDGIEKYPGERLNGAVVCDDKEIINGKSEIYRVSTDDVERMRIYHLRMLGEYQLENAAIAEQTARLLLGEEQENEDDIIRKGLEHAIWPGRMQILSESPFLLVDGAHNSNGVAALRRSLEAAYPGEKFHFLMGVMEDKDYAQMVEMMLPLAIDFVTVTPQSQRALAARDLAAQIRARGVPAQAAESVEEAIQSLTAQTAGSVKEELQELTGKSRTVAFGSLYFIGELCSVSGFLP